MVAKNGTPILNNSSKYRYSGSPLVNLIVDCVRFSVIKQNKVNEGFTSPLYRMYVEDRDNNVKIDIPSKFKAKNLYYIEHESPFMGGARQGLLFVPDDSEMIALHLVECLTSSGDKAMNFSGMYIGLNGEIFTDYDVDTCKPKDYVCSASIYYLFDYYAQYKSKFSHIWR